MFVRLWQALGRVADAVNGLADSLFGLRHTVDEISLHIRDRLALPAPDAAAPEVKTLATNPPVEQATESSRRRKKEHP